MGLIELLSSAFGIFKDLADWWREHDLRNQGRKEQQADDLKETTGRAVDAQQNREDVHRLSDDELNERLRKRGAGH